MEEEHKDRFRKIARNSYGIRSLPNNLKLEYKVNANSQFVETCEVTQAGETVTRGEGRNACDKALDDLGGLL